MPVYNGEAFVEAAIASALAQDGVLEILLYDDGSTDGSFDLLESIARSQPRLCLSRGPNRGAACARNHCLDHVRGDFVAFLDHDDLWPAGRMARQLDLLLTETSADAVLGHTLIFERLNKDGVPVEDTRSRRVLCGLLQAALFRRRALALIGSFDTCLTAADDFDLLLRLIERGSKLKIDADVAVFYRAHPGQWTADQQFAASQTLRALHMSLMRRRREGVTIDRWRLP